MGKIITRGYASRDVVYDHMTIKMKFSSREQDTKSAIRKITEECETFLGILKEKGIDISRIKAGSNSVDRHDYRDERTVSAYRNLEMRLPYNLGFVDYIMKMTEENSFSVDISVNCSFSSEEEVRNRLLEEATEDARKKAELMANATGMKIAGVERIKLERNDDYIFKVEEEYDDENEFMTEYMRAPVTGCGSGLYTELKAATTTESAEVFIEWILEPIIF